MRDKIEIYARPEDCTGLVVKKYNKEIWQAHNSAYLMTYLKTTDESLDGCR